MTGHARRCWWLAVAGCVLLLVGVATAASIRPADKRTVHLRLVPNDNTLPRAVP